jgi:hypothetical protein
MYVGMRARQLHNLPTFRLYTNMLLFPFALCMLVKETISCVYGLGITNVD